MQTSNAQSHIIFTACSTLLVRGCRLYYKMRLQIELLTIMFLHQLIFPLLQYAAWVYFYTVSVAFSVWGCLKKRVVVPKPPEEEELNQLLLISASQAAEMIRKREVSSCILQPRTYKLSWIVLTFSHTSALYLWTLLPF